MIHEYDNLNYKYQGNSTLWNAIHDLEIHTYQTEGMTIPWIPWQLISITRVPQEEIDGETRDEIEWMK